MTDEMELMMRLHLNNRRQGPGSDEMTELALRLAGLEEGRSYRVADVGCGTGAQTMVLGRRLRGKVMAVDLFQEFLGKLEERLRGERLSARVSTLVASMDDLPFGREELDVIWSEGAVYNMGFRRGVSYWREFLKPGGVLAVSELSWLTDERPAELEAFWNGEYSEMCTVAGKIRVLEEVGYKVIGYFVLPDSCWLENYYEPLLARHRDFLERFGDQEVTRGIVETDRREVDFYRKYKDYYGYGFYIAQKM